MQHFTCGLRRLAAGALCVTAALACSRSSRESNLTLNFGRVPRDLGGTCSSAAMGVSEFKAEIDGLRMRVSGPGISTPLEKEFTNTDEVQMDKIPAGSDRAVLVTGLKSGLSLWRGYEKGITVESGGTADVSMLLTRVADLTCAHNGLDSGTYFGTATRLSDGRVLVAGGVSIDTSTGASCEPSGGVCRDLTATANAAIFDPGTGRFEPTGSMLNPRAFHTATLMADGRVLMAGGARSGQVNSRAPFPIVPSDGVTPLEVYDPATGTFSAAGQDVEPNGRTFAAAILLTNGQNAGKVLISGGGSPTLWDTPLPQAGNTARALRSALLCSSDGLVTCSPTREPMHMRRVGHVMAELGDGTVMVFGGSIETGTESGRNDQGAMRDLSRQGPEFFGPVAGQNDDSFYFPVDRPQAVDDAGQDNNLFFGAAMQVKDFGLVFVGGVTRADDSDAINFREPGPQVWAFDPQARFLAPGTSGGSLQLAVPRFFPSVAPLDDGRNWVAAGGFSLLAGIEPSNALEIFNGGDGLFRQISVGGNPRTLRQPRGGAAAAALRNGTALLVGGMSKSDTGSPLVLDTAEIFTQREEPAP